MAASPKTKVSVVELEQQISKLSAALDKARAQEFAAAQKAVVARQKALASTKKKVTDITTKGVVTAAAKARLSQAKKDQFEAASLLAAAQEAFAGFKATQDAMKEVAKELALATKAKKVKKPVVKAGIKSVPQAAKATETEKPVKAAKPTKGVKPTKGAKSAKAVPAAQEAKAVTAKPAKSPASKKVKPAPPKAALKQASDHDVKSELALASVEVDTRTPVASEDDRVDAVTNIEAVTKGETGSVEAPVIPLTVSEPLPFDEDNSSLN